MPKSVKFAGFAAAAIALMPALALVQTQARPGATHRADAQPERLARFQPVSLQFAQNACDDAGCLPVMFRIGY